MKLREKVYLLASRLPTALFTVIQILLITRFVVRVIEIDPQLAAVQLLYFVTNILIFPFILLIASLNITEGSLIAEVLLLPSVIVYALSYEFIRMIIMKMVGMSEDE